MVSVPPHGTEGAVSATAPAPAPGHPSRLSGGEIVASGPTRPGPGAADTAGSGSRLGQLPAAAPGVDGTGPYVRPGLVPSRSRRRTGRFSAGSAAPTGGHPHRGVPRSGVVVALTLPGPGGGVASAPRGVARGRLRRADRGAPPRGVSVVGVGGGVQPCGGWLRLDGGWWGCVAVSWSSLWVHVTPDVLLAAFALVAPPGMAFAGLVTRQIQRLEGSRVEVPSSGASSSASDGGSWAVGPVGGQPMSDALPRVGRVVERPLASAGSPTPR